MFDKRIFNMHAASFQSIELEKSIKLKVKKIMSSYYKISLKSIFKDELDSTVLKK